MSNTLVAQDNNIGVNIKRISSREIAEIMEMRHDNLLRKIDNINKVLSVNEIYWIESSYKDKTGRALKEYLVSKEGCELLTQKSTDRRGYLLAKKTSELFPSEIKTITIIELDRKEVEFTNQLEEALRAFGIKGERQFPVLSYRIDYYIPSLNIAIEYDENDHKSYTYEAHEGRQIEIENELHCKFIRVSDKYTDSYNIGLVIKNIFNL